MSSAELLNKARAKHITIATAESCTAGMISAAITDEAGSSAIFDRGFVTYTNAAKMQMLDVQSDALDQSGAVSETVASQMAKGAVQNSSADIAVSVTGIAGPGGSDHKPEGRVCFAIARRNGTTETQTKEFGAIGRAKVRQATTEFAILLLIEAIDSV